jgi:hypothetical protein
MIAVILKSGHSIRHETADGYNFGDQSGRLYVMEGDKEVAIYSKGWQAVMVVIGEEGKIASAPGNDQLAQPAEDPGVPPDPDWYDDEEEDNDEE